MSARPDQAGRAAATARGTAALELARHAKSIELIEQTLIAQADLARATAPSTLIEQEELRTLTLREWGARAGDEKMDANGIKAAARRIEEYREQLRKYVADWRLSLRIQGLVRNLG